VHIVKWQQKKWQQFYRRLTNCAIMWVFCVICNLFCVSATVSYGKIELLDIRTAITHLGLDKDFSSTSGKHRIYYYANTRQGQHPRYGQEEETQVQRTQGGVLCKDPQKASVKAAVTFNITRQCTIIGQ
jgi:hypothetical protein